MKIPSQHKRLVVIKGKLKNKMKKINIKTNQKINNNRRKKKRLMTYSSDLSLYKYPFQA
jgi:acyl-CoA thioesterase